MESYTITLRHYVSRRFLKYVDWTQYATVYILKNLSLKNIIKHLQIQAMIRLHDGEWAFVLNFVSFTRLHAIEFQRKDLLWRQISSNISIKMYMSLVLLSLRKEHPVSHKISMSNSWSFRQSLEVIILRNFNLKNEAWLKSNKTGSDYRAMEVFNISHGLSQLSS